MKEKIKVWKDLHPDKKFIFKKVDGVSYISQDILDILIKEEYWKGFEKGRQSSLKHNVILMKLQIKGSKEQEEGNKIPKEKLK